MYDHVTRAKRLISPNKLTSVIIADVNRCFRYGFPPIGSVSIVTFAAINATD